MLASVSRVGVALAAALLSGGPAFAAPVRCSIDTKFYCTPTQCLPVAATVWNIVDPAEGTYARCDQLGCDSYTAIFTQSGAVTVIDIPGRGVLGKLSVTGDFTEIATLGNEVYLSFGRCGP